MKVYLQPASTFALALAVGSLTFTLPRISEVQVGVYNGAPSAPIHVKVVSGCN